LLDNNNVALIILAVVEMFRVFSLQQLGMRDPRRSRMSYHSLAWRLMRLGRNVLFPEMLCFSSVTVATPISLSFSLLSSLSFSI
jgi:hypothetical protein